MNFAYSEQTQIEFCNRNVTEKLVSGDGGQQYS